MFNQSNEMLLELCPFAISGHLMLLLIVLNISLEQCMLMYANVLKFQIWIPHEKRGDPYCFLTELPPILELFPF